jgi:hypothetical protein
MGLDNPRYALVPKYRATGPHHLLWWHEYDEGNNVLAARGEESLVRAWGAVLDKEPHAKIVHAYRGSIVLPPEWMADGNRRWRYHLDLSFFRTSVRHRAETYAKAHGVLPDKLAPCPAYMPQYPEEEEEDEETRAYHLSMHSLCLNCDGEKLVLAPGAGTWEQYFEARGEDVFRDIKPVPIPAPFDGQAADPALPVVAFYPANFASGIHVNTLTPEDMGPDGHYTGGDVLFCFQGEEVDLPALDALQAEARERNEKREAERKAENIARHEKRKAEKLEEAIRLFEGKL